jgi:hypothetical protein
MFRQLPMAFAALSIVTSRSVPLYMPCRLFSLPFRSRSHHAIPKTAIPVSMVVHGMNPCKTCAHFPFIRYEIVNIQIYTGFRFSQGLQTAIAGCSSRVSVRFQLAPYPFILLTHSSSQMTKCGRRRPRRRLSFVYLEQLPSVQRHRSTRAGGSLP